MNNIENISGGISGAISDPHSPEAQEHAELFLKKYAIDSMTLKNCQIYRIYS